MKSAKDFLKELERQENELEALLEKVKYLKKQVEDEVKLEEEIDSILNKYDCSDKEIDKTIDKLIEQELNKIINEKPFPGFKTLLYDICFIIASIIIIWSVLSCF